MDDSQESDIVIVVKYLTMGSFFWFVATTLILQITNSKDKWGRDDYLSPAVIMIALAIIVLLEYFVY